MSRRRKPPAGQAAPTTRDTRVGGRDAPTTRREARAARTGAGGGQAGRILRDVVVLLLAFGVGVGVAELFGAANLGVAFGVGQIVFATALVVLLTRD
jgi:hypothetical protein